MSHLLFWPTIKFFFPVGNTSAVSLTENLSPESEANVLLVACGDPRHILYTIYADETNPLACSRTLDITCCDVDVAILARNALLFSLLADDGVLDRLDGLWNLFYHLFVDQASLSILLGQCRKLVGLAASPEIWRAGPYGHFLTTCDTATLAELRRVWTAYLDTAAFSSKRAKQFEQQTVDGMKENSRKRGGGTSTAARSAGPLAPLATDAVLRQFRSYWSSGTTADGARGQKRSLTVNPTFTFSIDGDKFSVHYGTDPLLGFHLAEAFASGKFTQPHECIPPHELVRVAKDQFSRWCTSMSKRLKSNNPSSPTFVIRMFGGDALMFCQALKYCEVTQSTVTPYNVAACQLSTVTLDGHCYGRDAASPAPLSFNVIDTSNLLDHAGLVNVLVVTAPLLHKTPSATLYTEALLRKGDNPSHAILEHVCGDLATMALLLGIIPSTFISQFSTRSNVHENFMMGDNAKQYHERLAWKVIGLGGPPPNLCFAPKDLAAFLFRVYAAMFADEDMEAKFRSLSLSPESMIRNLQGSGVLHYNRRSFALLMHPIKTRVQTDWWRAMNILEDMVLTDRRLLMGQHAYQELCCQLHLLGVYTADWLTVASLHRQRLEYQSGAAGVFRDWTQSRIPPVVTLVLVVPREAIAKLESDFKDVGTPVLQCDMDDGMRQNLFAVASATFGTLRVSGTGEHRMGVVVEGESSAGAGAGAGTSEGAMRPLWRTGAPLIVTFSIPSTSVMDFGRNPGATVGLALRATPRVATKFTGRLGPSLTVFRTQLRDAKKVFVLVRCPVVGTCEDTSAGSDARTSGAAVLVDHWQENMKEQAASSRDTVHQGKIADVHVQMDNMFSTVQSFTVRVDVTDSCAKAVLANPQTVPTVNSGSGSNDMRTLDAYVKIGEYTFPIQFPLPTNVQRAKLRVARRSSYVEVIAPLTSFDVRPECNLSNRFALLSSDPDGDGTPVLGCIHRLNLDRCPRFKLSKGPSGSGWYDLHVSLMFSELEKRRALCDPPAIGNSTSGPAPPDTLLKVKRTLHLLLRSAAGAASNGKAPETVFGLCDTSRQREPYLYIIVACMRLDVGSHTVIIDAFVAPLSPAVQRALMIAIRDLFVNPDEQIRYIGTDADETAAWFHLIPRLVERCRTWPHKPSCVYRTSKHSGQKTGEETVGMWERQSPLCACGVGVGTEDLPKAFKWVAPHLTRAAFSPLFSVPYLKEIDVPFGGPTRVTPTKTSSEADTSAQDRSTDVGKLGAMGVGHRCCLCGKEGGLTCSRCKRARYCSKECQRADWKDHKKDCGSAHRVEA